MKVALLAFALAWSQGVEPAAVPAERFTVAATGDLLIHGPVAQRALSDGGGRRYDFAPMFGAVRSRIAGADLALCHVETPLVPGPVQGYPMLSHAARPRALDPRGGLGRLQHGVEPLARRRPVRSGHHAARARGRRRAARRHRALAAREPADHDPRREGGAGRLSVLHRREQRPGPCRTPGASTGPTPGASSPTPAGRGAAGARHRDREPPLGRRVQPRPSRLRSARSRAGSRARRRSARSSASTRTWSSRSALSHGKPVVFGEGNLVSNQTAACCPAASQDGLVALIDFVARRLAGAGPAGALPAYLGSPSRLPRAARRAGVGLVAAHGRGGRPAAAGAAGALTLRAG